MKTTLSHIARVQAGVFAIPEKQGEVLYLQAKHFNEEGILTQVLYPELKLNGKVERYLLEDEDILFAAKGSRNFASVYYSKSGLAVASPTFLIARISSVFRPKLLPEFLAWYINHPKNLASLKAAATGSNMPAITSPVLKEMEIYIPPIEKQEAILETHTLRTEEKRIRQRLESLRETLIQNQLLRAVKH